MRKFDALLLADTFEAFMTKLEAFGDHFERLATTVEQHELSAQFNAFVGEIIHATISPGKESGHLVPDTEYEAFLKQHGHESFSSLLAEIRADEAAAKQEDAQWYGREAFKKILDGPMEVASTEMAKDKGIER
jgi:hypothetical protein